MKAEGQYAIQRGTRAWLSGEQEAVALGAECMGVGRWARDLDMMKGERSISWEGPGDVRSLKRRTVSYHSLTSAFSRNGLFVALTHPVFPHLFIFFQKKYLIRFYYMPHTIL